MPVVGEDFAEAIGAGASEMHGISGAQKIFRGQSVETFLGVEKNWRVERQPAPYACFQVRVKLLEGNTVFPRAQTALAQVTVKNSGQFDASGFAAGDSSGGSRVLTHNLAAGFLKVALGQISGVVVGQRRSSSRSRAESTSIEGSCAKPRTSFRRAKGVETSSSAGSSRAAGRPRSRTSTPLRPRAAVRTQ